MTKAQLIKTLEPLPDDIQIVAFDGGEPLIFFRYIERPEIVISGVTPNKGVELKIK